MKNKKLILLADPRKYFTPKSFHKFEKLKEGPVKAGKTCQELFECPVWLPKRYIFKYKRA